MVSLLNGLSSLGAGVATFAGSAGLEQQKADLMQQQTILADQLAGAREDKMRTFQSGENAADRTNRLATTNISANAQVQSAGIGAGATLGAAQINATAQQAINQANIEAAKVARATLGADVAATVSGQEKVAKIGVAGSTTNTQLLVDKDKAISADQIAAASTRLMMQLNADKTTVITNADDGLASTFNSITGKLEPIIAPNGEQLRLPNPELAKLFATQTTSISQQANELLRARAQDVAAGEATIARLLNSSTLLGAEKDRQVAAAQADMNNRRESYDTQLKSLANQQQGVIAASMSMAPKSVKSPSLINGGSDATARPPLSSLEQPTVAPRKDQ